MKTLPFVDGLHNVLLYGAAIAAAWSVFTVANAFVAEANFEILSSEIVCQQPLNNRCGTRYSVKDMGGSFARTYKPDDNLFSTDELTIGNKIQKARFSFSYLVNGREMHWAYGYDVLTAVFLSAVAFVFWCRLTVAFK